MKRQLIIEQIECMGDTGLILYEVVGVNKHKIYSDFDKETFEVMFNAYNSCVYSKLTDLTIGLELLKNAPIVPNEEVEEVLELIENSDSAYCPTREEIGSAKSTVINLQSLSTKISEEDMVEQSTLESFYNQECTKSRKLQSKLQKYEEVIDLFSNMVLETTVDERDYYIYWLIMPGAKYIIDRVLWNRLNKLKSLGGK